MQHAVILYSQWRHVAPIGVKFGTGSGQFPVPNFNLISAEMWNYSPKTVDYNFFSWMVNCLHNFYEMRKQCSRPVSRLLITGGGSFSSDLDLFRV